MLRTKKQTKSIHGDDIHFIETVLAYYEAHGRHDLPWRKKISAYRILVSEIMLQQTQVSRVIPKFDVWMKQYPTITSLGSSSLEAVLILWQGLGYQRRAKALLQIAKQEKKVPNTFEDLLTLPGIGTYTAGAIMAFAYNSFSHPIIETNIRTALIEYFHQGEESIHDGLLYDDLTRLVKSDRILSTGARTWYYALMDFGAHLKSERISHNTKSAHYTKQSPYKGSKRELRAQVLFSIAHNKNLPEDDRLHTVLEELMKEGYIDTRLKRGRYQILK